MPLTDREKQTKRTIENWQESWRKTEADAVAEFSKLQSYWQENPQNEFRGASYQEYFLIRDYFFDINYKEKLCWVRLISLPSFSLGMRPNVRGISVTSLPTNHPVRKHCEAHAVKETREWIGKGKPNYAKYFSQMVGDLDAVLESVDE